MALLVVACQKTEESVLSGEIGSGSAPGSGGSGGVGSGMAGKRGSGAGSAFHKSNIPEIDLDTKDILTRTTTTPSVYVKHVLLGWADLLPAYRGHLDPRAAKRTNADAAKLAKQIYAKLKAAPDSIDAVIKESSEDPGSLTGNPYTVTEKSQFVPEFKKLALRLNEKEVGIVKTQFGYHIMERVPKPPLDQNESAAILNRPKKSELVEVQHILIGWKDSPAAADPRAKARSKEDAGKLAQDILAKVKAGGDMTKLTKEFSEDPGSKDTARAYTVTEEEALVEGFKALALRLDLGEAGIVKTEFGYHIMKRVKADPLQSTEILARPIAAEKTKIKYILLGWKDAHIDDKRGQDRDRPALEKLVKETLAKLANKSVTFEELMKGLSEDKQTGATGMSIDASIPGLPSAMKMLAQRLKIDEIGVVKTQFGIFIIKRIDETKVETPTGSGSAAKPGPGSAAKPVGSGSAAKPAGSGSAK